MKMTGKVQLGIFRSRSIISKLSNKPQARTVKLHGDSEHTNLFGVSGRNKIFPEKQRKANSENSVYGFSRDGGVHYLDR